MGQQQLLLIILGVIIVGIAIAVGLSLFSAQSVQANKDAMINDINNIAANAYQFYIRPASMGGGQNAYSGGQNSAPSYNIPTRMASNENATYHATASGQTCLIHGDSKMYVGSTVEVTIASDGRPTSAGWSYTGEFQN
jgi:hypothetical protein